jgi:hypothetical protein
MYYQQVQDRFISNNADRKFKSGNLLMINKSFALKKIAFPAVVHYRLK